MSLSESDFIMGMPVYMDLEGQRLAERLFQAIVVVFGGIGWLYGYYIQDFLMTVITLGAGLVLASLVTLPPWPIYRRNPLKWCKPQNTGQQTTVDGLKKKKLKN